MKPFVRDPYNYDAAEASNESGTDNTEPSMTVQSMSEETDINIIIARFGLGARMPENPKIPTYGDFTGISDYRSAFEAVANAERQFMELPAQVRSHFDNDPQQLLQFTEQGGNLLEVAAALVLPKNPEPQP